MRRQWSAEEKLRIVLEGLRPHASVEEICRRQGLHSSQYIPGERRRSPA